MSLASKTVADLKSKIKALEVGISRQSGLIKEKLQEKLEAHKSELESRGESLEKETEKEPTKKTETKLEKAKKTIKKEAPAKKEKITVKSVTIVNAEGDQSKYDNFPKTYYSWNDVQEALKPIVDKDLGGYNKVKFTIAFDSKEDDGYEGRLDVSEKEDNPFKDSNVIATHVKDHLNLVMKESTDEDYKEDIKEWLEVYDLTAPITGKPDKKDVKKDSKSEADSTSEKEISATDLIKELEKRIKEAKGDLKEDIEYEFKSIKEDTLKHVDSINKLINSGLSRAIAYNIYLGEPIAIEGEESKTESLVFYKEDYKQQAIKEIIKNNNDNKFEAGFKYLKMDKKELDKLGFDFVGNIEFEEKDYKGNPRQTSRDVYITKSCKTVLFFEKGRAADGGYSGLYSLDLAEGKKIAKAISNNKDSYAKSVEYYTNGKIWMDESVILDTMKDCVDNKGKSSDKKTDKKSSKSDITESFELTIDGEVFNFSDVKSKEQCEKAIKAVKARREEQIKHKEARAEGREKAKTVPVTKKITGDMADAVKKAVSSVSDKKIKTSPEELKKQIKAVESAFKNVFDKLEALIGKKIPQTQRKEIEEILSKLEDKVEDVKVEKKEQGGEITSSDNGYLGFLNW
jgi:hypothetical protein